MERKTRALAEGTIVTGGAGGFTGYASVFEPEVDSEGDTVARGAYAETLPAFRHRGFIATSHSWQNPVATIKAAREDDYGLWLEAEFHSDPESQVARTRTVERLARGKPAGLSIGFQPLDFERTATGRRLTRIELFEASLVAVPALASAGVLAAKGRAAPPSQGAGPDLDDAIGLLKQGAEVVVLVDRGRIPDPLRRAADRAATAASQALGLPNVPAVRWYAGRHDPEWAPAHAFSRGPVDRLAAPVDARAFFSPIASPSAIYLRASAVGSPWEAAESAVHETAHLWQRATLGVAKMTRATAAQSLVLEQDAEAFTRRLLTEYGDELTGEGGA